MLTISVTYFSLNYWNTVAISSFW